MFNRSLPIALGSAIAATGLLVSAALADSAMLPADALAANPPVATGQTAQISLAAGQPACDTAQLYTFSYPGDGSLVSLTGVVNGLSGANANLAGINLWDGTSTTSPAQVDTPSYNGAPGSAPLAVDYVSNTAGTVTVEVYNWTQSPLQVSLTPVQLPNGAMLQPVAQPAAGSCASQPQPSPAAQ
ncbi:MAG: hypothetical protein JO247_11375 [Chloroflexi bacterium]|nr:hypothetical protein [Chloroflexota bacterium]